MLRITCKRAWESWKCGNLQWGDIFFTAKTSIIIIIVFFFQVTWFSIDGEPFEAKTITISLLPQKLHFFFNSEDILWQVIKDEEFILAYFVTLSKKSNPIALPDPYFYWSLWPVPSIVTGVWVVSSIVLFSITDCIWKGIGSVSYKPSYQ